MSHTFHAHPIIHNQFPGGLASFGSIKSLPVLDLLTALIIKRIKFPNDPVRAVFGGSGHVSHYTGRKSKINQYSEPCGQLPVIKLSANEEKPKPHQMTKYPSPENDEIPKDLNTQGMTKS
jgi:hypothetical protein